MGRFVNSQTGVIVTVADHKDNRFAAPLWRVDDGSAPGSTPAAGPAGSESAGGYDGLKVDDLKAEIERRNTGRDTADLLSTEGRKADLVAVLVADDTARTGQQ
ncbi:SAP domain-containing protein [Micromonospora sp. NPDC051300]|uniref:SAP domain-containing protein n=1 Tax=Micromonospora sp. NPDC051300 TaxID=3364286 RepID=UPI0037916EAA